MRRMIRRTIVLVLTALVFVVAIDATATAAKSCDHGIRMHNGTCKVAERVISKWASLGYPKKRFEVRGNHWSCGVIPVPFKRQPFGCGNHHGSYIEGEIVIRR